MAVEIETLFYTAVIPKYVILILIAHINTKSGCFTGNELADNSFQENIMHFIYIKVSYFQNNV